MGLMGHRRGAHQPTRGGAPPKEGGRIGEGGGGSPPLSFLLPLFPFPPSGKRKGGGRIGLPLNNSFLDKQVAAINVSSCGTEHMHLPHTLNVNARKHVSYLQFIHF